LTSNGHRDLHQTHLYKCYLCKNHHFHYNILLVVYLGHFMSWYQLLRLRSSKFLYTISSGKK
jgi:hypothetical protein